MKRLLSVLLTLTLLFSMVTTAFAAEEPTTAISVGSMEELQNVVAAAVDGDTIEVNQRIVLTGAISTDKQITITRASGYSSGTLLELRDNAVLDGFTVSDNVGSSTIVINFSTSTPAVIRNCTFNVTGEQGSSCISITGNMDINKVVIEDCSFYGRIDRAVKIMSNAEVEIKGCTLDGGGINNNGELTIDNTTITGGVGESGGGILNAGVLTVSDCHIYGNTATNEGMGTDIHSFGTLSMTGGMTEGEGFYDEATGKKITLPISYTALTKLVYLTDEAAAERFAPPTPNPEPEPEPNPQPNPQPGDNGDDGDYTPPVQRPSRPTTTTTAPIVQPAVTPVRSLACGNAVLDVSRSVALDGYSGGKADDYLTRAQLATIIYHLLDANTLAKYDTAQCTFTDVPANASYSRHVAMVTKAGIIDGVGNGFYNPNGRLTWAHALTVLTRFVKSENYTLQNIKYDGWAVKAVQTAVAHDWIRDRADFKPTASITLGEFVEFFNSILGLYQTI
ncbi:MAG: S-layer homology domain-containing protein [Anaerovoracaceae bacterium]